MHTPPKSPSSTLVRRVAPFGLAAITFAVFGPVVALVVFVAAAFALTPRRRGSGAAGRPILTSVGGALALWLVLFGGGAMAAYLSPVGRAPGEAVDGALTAGAILFPFVLMIGLVVGLVRASRQGQRERDAS